LLGRPRGFIVESSTSSCIADDVTRPIAERVFVALELCARQTRPGELERAFRRRRANVVGVP
jgi:hypothetical protein